MRTKLLVVLLPKKNEKNKGMQEEVFENPLSYYSPMSNQRSYYYLLSILALTHRYCL